MRNLLITFVVENSKDIKHHVKTNDNENEIVNKIMKSKVYSYNLNDEKLYVIVDKIVQIKIKETF